MRQFLWILLMLASSEAKEVFYHTYYGTPLSHEDIVQQTKANTTFWCSIGIKQPCDPNEGRRLDGSCNNLQYPTIGAMHTPQINLLPPEFGKDNEPRLAQSGKPKALCRHIRTTLLATGTRPDQTFTQLAINYFLFGVSDVLNVHDTVNYVTWKPFCCLPKGKTDPICTPMQVPNDDPVHRFSGIRCLNMTRPITYQISGCTMGGSPERFISALPLFDVSFVYGSNLESSLKKGRLYKRGLLKYELLDGRVFPPSVNSSATPTVCYLNEPPHETRCHDTPDVGMNALMGSNLFAIWFWRNHNRIASTLADLNPSWNDEKLFYTARDINIATFVQIFYYELMPLVLGRNNLERDAVLSDSRGFRDTYNPHVLPQISIDFAYILRWVHLMQEGRVKMYDEAGNYLKQMPVVNLTLRTGYFAIDNNIDYLTQGSFRQASGKVDYTIDPDMADRVLGGLQRASDVATSDLEKGRYGGFPPYIEYVKYCTGKTIRNFEDLKFLIDADKLELLRDLYENVRDIELMSGTWVERPIEGGFAPPTFYCIVVDQLIRSMESDRHWYERPNRPNAFTLQQLQEIRKITISRVLCDVGDKVTQIQRRSFERIGPKNKIVSCDEIEGIDLTAWKDTSCETS